MQLIITEKNDAAKQIANILGSGRAKADHVYKTPVFRFNWNGDECVTIGLRGHILEPNFVENIQWNKTRGWFSKSEEFGRIEADIPKNLPTPPFKKKKPFMEDGVDLKGWKMEALPYLVYSPIIKLPKEKEIIRSLKNLAKKSDVIIIATDFDREGELIGKDAMNLCLEVSPDVQIFRSRYSSFTKQEITESFENLVDVDECLASAGCARQDIDLIWGAALTRYLTLARFAGYGNVRSSGRVQTPTLALVVAKERERQAFVPEKFWVLTAQVDSSQEAGPTRNDSESSSSVFDCTHVEEGFLTKRRQTLRSKTSRVQKPQ